MHHSVGHTVSIGWRLELAPTLITIQLPVIDSCNLSNSTNNAICLTHSEY